MQHYTINGKYLLKETFEDQQQVQQQQQHQEPSSVDQGIVDIFNVFKDKVIKEIDDHQKDLLNNISIDDNNIGVGITKPTHKITVKSDSYEDNINIIGNYKTKGPGITLTNDLNNSGYLILGGSESDLGQGNLGFGFNNN